VGRRTILLVSALACCAAVPTSARHKSYKALLDYLREGGIDLPRGHYFVRNISAPGKQPTLALVYLEGRDWCGSSGCELMIVDTSGSKPRTVAEASAWTPIIHDGWSNGYEIIGVWHHGGGAMKPFCDELRFTPYGSEYVRETKRERTQERKRCASSETVLLKKDWY
jgi:hypothetical protein